MDAQRKRDIAIAVFVIGIYSAWFIVDRDLFSALASEFSDRGIVESVSGSDGVQEAIVQLNRGGKVTAAVPSQCLLLPGYVVTLRRSRDLLSSGPKYTVLTAKGKE